MTTQIQVSRMKNLYAMMAGIPEHRVKLTYWRSDQDIEGSSPIHNCGTTACAIGFATAYPPFIKQGLGWKKSGEPKFGMNLGFNAVEAFFGISYPRARLLFVDGGYQDNREYKAVCKDDGDHRTSDKRKVLARIRNSLLLDGVITQARCDELREYEAGLV